MIVRGPLERLDLLGALGTIEAASARADPRYAVRLQSGEKIFTKAVNLRLSLVPIQPIPVVPPPEVPAPPKTSQR